MLNVKSSARYIFVNILMLQVSVKLITIRGKYIPPLLNSSGILI